MVGWARVLRRVVCCQRWFFHIEQMTRNLDIVTKFCWSKYMYNQVVEIRGSQAGPVSIILAGVHGDELCGVQAIQEITPGLEVARGVVRFVFGNPRALAAHVRYTEENLNRMFGEDEVYSARVRQSYEFRRAQELKQLFHDADALLDLHASHTPESIPFAICERNAADLVRYLPVKRVVSGFDAVQPGGTDYYMNSLGKIGICIECGYINDSSAFDVARDSILAFLVARGHIDGQRQTYPQSNTHIDQLYRTKTDRFRLAQPFSDFAQIDTGELIGHDGDEEIRAKRAGIIVFARDRDAVDAEAFLLGVEG